MKTIYYLGPELTYSYEAARRMRALAAGWAEAELVACATAREIWERVLSAPESGAVVPLFNVVQGDVFDFSRFYLLEQLLSFDLPLRFYLYSRAAALEEIEIIYTKDTILPQVSRWLESLPAGVRLEARPDISSAGAARQAAADPRAAAICSAAAGEAYDLRPLAEARGNRPDNFTRFGLFRRPAGWWEPPAGLFDRLELPLNLGEREAAALASGRASLRWTVTLAPATVLHLGHLSPLLTLRKFARRGSRVIVAWQGAGELTGDHVARYERALRRVIDTPLLADFRPAAEGAPPADEIIVAGLAATRALKEAGRRGILLEHVPGRDGYAKMSTSRGNVIPWPVPELWRDDPAVRLIFARHFPAERLAAAGLQAFNL